MGSFGAIRNRSASNPATGPTTSLAVPKNAALPDSSKEPGKTNVSSSYEGRRDRNSFFSTNLRSMANKMFSRSAGTSPVTSQFPASPATNQFPHHASSGEAPEDLSPRSPAAVDRNLPTIHVELFGEADGEKGAPLSPQMQKYIKETCINFGKSYEDIRKLSCGEDEIKLVKELKDVALQFAGRRDAGLGDTEETAANYLKLEARYTELQNLLSLRIPIPRTRIEENESHIREMIAQAAEQGLRVTPLVLHAAAGRIEKGVSSVKEEREGYQGGASITHKLDVKMLKRAANFREKMPKPEASDESAQPE